MNLNFPAFLILSSFLYLSCSDADSKVDRSVEQDNRMKVLIIDGENNHGVFPMTTMMFKDYLEETGLFTVDIERTKYLWQGPHHNEIEGIDTIIQLLTRFPLDNDEEYISVVEPKPDTSFHPDFKSYDLVVSNFGWKASTWPSETKADFESYMKEGGGFVLVHAANNSWADWPEYNKMIGLGGWGGRNEVSGPFVYYDGDDQLQYDTSAGPAGSHGPQSEFKIKTRAPQHPIMKGLPETWMHTKDELYARLRGPAENLTVLATAFSGQDENSKTRNKNRIGLNRHEPMLMAIEYGKGRVFHTALGHMDYSVECVGFITTFQRGAEWAASGKVTQDVPEDFPSKEKSSSRKWSE